MKCHSETLHHPSMVVLSRKKCARKDCAERAREDTGASDRSVPSK